MLKGKIVLLAGAVAILGSATLNADIFTGTLYYTNFNGGENVNKVDYTYDDSTKTLALVNQQGIAALAGADGIIFDASGHLLVGGQGANALFKLNTDGSGISSVHPPGNSFHLALDPTGNFVYTSTFVGPLDVVPLSPFADGTQHTVHGDDAGVTQLAFAPDTGKVFYANSNPNCCGNFGFIDISDLTNIQTTRIGTGKPSVHGIIFDPYTKMITTFGGGWAGAFKEDGTGFHEGHVSPINGDFDQGAPDGKGHAFIAGNGGITFVDYRVSGDITAPNFSTFVGGFNGIDDLAPLSGVGSNNNQVPEPASILLLGSVLAGFVAYRRRRSQTI